MIREHDLKVEPRSRVLAGGRDWSMVEFVCTAGPDDRPFEEERAHVSVAAVLDGTFTYTCDVGTALLHSGALLLGNAGTCYACGHDHGTGDRCIAFQLSPDYFAEMATSIAGSNYRFPVAMLPAGQTPIALIAAISARAARPDTLACEELTTALIEAVVMRTAAIAPKPQVVSPRDLQRITAALRLLDHASSEPLDLDRLAREAGMSKYHFLRVFRRVTNTTPYRYLLDLRLRHVAHQLATTEASISTLAFDAGFGDLSTFADQFKRRFGLRPSCYRMRYGPS